MSDAAPEQRAPTEARKTMEKPSVEREMGAPPRKEQESMSVRPEAHHGSPAPSAPDPDLESFRATRAVSRRATAKELDRLMRPKP